MIDFFYSAPVLSIENTHNNMYDLQYTMRHSQLKKINLSQSCASKELSLNYPLLHDQMCIIWPEDTMLTSPTQTCPTMF